MKYKSYIAKIAIILILALSFINTYNKTSNFVYADTTTDQWENVSTNQELSEAFRYYCKSRNLAIEGSIADALTTFTTNSFNTICNTLGIDVTALQAHLKRSTDSNGKIQFLFDEFGITAYNRIFAEFLQNNNIEVGDEVADTTLYSGRYFTDADGNTCLVYVLTSNLLSNSNDADSGQKNISSLISAYGTTYLWDFNSLKGYYNNGGGSASVNLTNSINGTFTFNKYASTSRVTVLEGSYSYSAVTKQLFSYSTYINDFQSNSSFGIFTQPNNTLYFGYLEKYRNSTNAEVRCFAKITSSDNIDVVAPTTIIFITTNNNTINNNTYNDNKQTVINNEGDVYNYDYDDDEPPVNPGGGSGGGGDNTNINIDFPNFDFNIPDIDFSLKGLTGKFPFCIPFDMVALLTLLNAEPQAPRIQGAIPFGSFFTWNLDLDFSRFNDFALIMRGLEFVGFIFFLVGATINIAKG